MSESKAALRRQLAAQAPYLRPIAENVLAAAQRIDVVALDPDGIAHTILFAAANEDPAALTHAVAASTWLSARLADWRQLAPDAGIHSAAPARAVVVAERFHPDTLTLAELLGAERIRLIALPSQPERVEEPQAAAPAPAPGAEGEASPAPSQRPPATPAPSTANPETRFRTGLEAADLAFTTT